MKKTVIHMVTEFFPPTCGGLERRTKYLAQAFSLNGFKVIVHILSAEYDYSYYEAFNEGIEIRVPYQSNAILMHPIEKSTSPEFNIGGETWRNYFMCLKNQVVKEIRNFSGNQHILISNYLTRMGIISSYVAEEIDIPHIASVVGTDFSRGFRNTTEHSAIESIAKKASAIVTLNNQFKAALQKIEGCSNTYTIHGSIEPTRSKIYWKQNSIYPIKLFSDGGFSHKKGTQILLHAFKKLFEDGIDVSLTICGPVMSGQEDYWTGLKNQFKTKYIEKVEFYDYLSNDEISQILLKSNFYCSATLGEGCSNARMAALCAGIPIVTTECGEMADVATDCSHVKMSLPGDVEGYYRVLKNAIIDMINGRLMIDEVKVEYWKKYFVASREIKEWIDVINKAIG